MVPNKKERKKTECLCLNYLLWNELEKKYSSVLRLLQGEAMSK